MLPASIVLFNRIIASSKLEVELNALHLFLNSDNDTKALYASFPVLFFIFKEILLFIIDNLNVCSFSS